MVPAITVKLARAKLPANAPHSRIVKEVKSDNSQFPIILVIVKNFWFIVFYG